jgi:hypothetical protein
MSGPELSPARRPALAAGRPIAALVATAILALLLVAAWLVPPLAMAVVWPALFVVPGWAAMAMARPRVGATGRLGLAIVISVTLSAHAVYWLSLATGGYERWTIFVVAGLLLLPIPAGAWLRGAAGLRAQVRSGIRGLRQQPLAFAFAGVAAAFVGLVLDNGLWKATLGGVSAGGSNWSDLGVHLSIAQSLNAGNFPPQVPYFADAPLVYHWFADFHSAIVARAAGMFAIPAFVISSGVMAGALALLVHGLAQRLLRGQGARRAALLAAVLVVFGGGLAWIRLVGDLANGAVDPIGLVLNNSYDNSWYDASGQVSWPYFRIPSVMGTGLLVHRATTYGLPILVGAVLLLVAGLPSRRRLLAGWRDRPVLIGLAGLVGAMLAPFHFFFFPAFLLLALLYVLAGKRLLDTFAPRNAGLLLLPMLLAVPFAASALSNADGSGALKTVLGWESAPMQDGPLAVAFFYLTNLGVPFVLALVALLAPGTRWRWFLAGWVAALFAIPNLLQVSVVAFDMNKYFQAMWVAVALLAAWLIRRWPWPAIALVLLLSIPSPLLVSAWTAFNREQVLSWDEIRAAEWMAANTPQRSVFATDGWLNSPTDPAGRLRLLTFTPYVANLGFDPDERAAQVHDIYCADAGVDTVALLRRVGADYVIAGRASGDCTVSTDFDALPGLELVYTNDSVRIWRVLGAG